MFQDALQLTLDLSIKNNVFHVVGGDILDFRVDLQPYGFEAQAEFRVFSDTHDDALLKSFAKQDLIDARLTIQAVYNLPDPAPEPLIVRGLVTRKSFRETSFVGVTGQPVYVRNYSITFRDPARVLWTQHFPTALYTNASMETVIRAQVPESVSLDIDWLRLMDKDPIYFLGLGDGQNRCSFYDFLMWYVYTFNGVFVYNTQSQTYHLRGGKKDEGEPQSLRLQDYAGFSLHIPESCRHNVQILNIYSENPQKIPVPNTQGAGDVRRDVLVRRETPLALASDTLRESPKLDSRLHELRLVMQRFPVVPFSPGIICGLSEVDTSKEIYAYGKEYRVCRIHLTAAAEKKGLNDERGALFKAYTCDMTAALEPKEEKTAALPAFKAPGYPLSVEGRIVSEAGEEKDKTYQFYAGHKTKESYHVFIPLWNQTIPVPYDPGFQPGHFYFPAYKNTRVLVDLYFDEAKLNRYLDWGADVRLPMDTQGNHLLMGKNETTDISMSHVYTDGKPVFNTKRIHGTDMEYVKMEEGRVVIEVKEDESLPSAEEKFDVTPKAAAAMTECDMKIEAARDELKGNFESTSGQVNGELDAAVTRTKGALDKMDEAISGKTAEITGKVEAAMSDLSEKSGALTGKVKTLSGELKEKISL